MRKLMTSLVIAFLALSVWAQDASAPIIKFSKDTHDFGTIEKGSKVVTEFEFVNAGKSVLTIEDVKTSCGCTTATPEKREYQPGEKGVIPVTFDSSRFANKITKTITVMSNDPENSKYYLKILGNVESEIEAKPTLVSLYNVKREDTEREIEISSNKLAKLEVSDITSDLDFVTVKTQAVDDKNVKLLINIMGSKAPKTTTTFRGEVKLKTNGEKVNEISIPVHLKFEEPIRVLPRFISFFGSKKGEARTVTVVLTSTDKKPFKVLSASADIEGVSVAPSNESIDQHQVEVKLSESAAEGKFAGFLIMKTDMEDMPEIRIPIRGSVL